MLCSSAHSLVKFSVWVYCIGTDQSFAFAMICYTTIGRAAGLPPSALVDCAHTMSLQDSMALQAATDLTNVWMSVIEHNKTGQNAISISRTQSCHVKLLAVDKSYIMLSGCFTFTNSIKITAKKVLKDHANKESGKDHCINFRCAWQAYMLQHDAVLLCSLTCTCIFMMA